MSLFSKPTTNTLEHQIDRKSPAYAVIKFNIARSNLFTAILLTIINIVVGCLGAGFYLLFSISFPYFMFDIYNMKWSIPALVVLAFYIVCYFLSKKRPGFMIAALVAFILDSLFLIGYSLLLAGIPELEISIADFIIDYLTHIWVLAYLIIGTVYTGRYRAAIRENPSILEGSVFKGASVPEENIPADDASLTQETDAYGFPVNDTHSNDDQSDSLN